LPGKGTKVLPMIIWPAIVGVIDAKEEDARSSANDCGMCGLRRCDEAHAHHSSDCANAALYCFKCEVCGCPRTEEGDPIQIAKAFTLNPSLARSGRSRGL